MENPKLLPELRFTPAVFAVKDEYQIIVLARAEIVFWVTVNGKEYYDWSSGVLRSAGSPHRVSVPMSELDAAREYTVHYRRMVDRLIAFSTTEEVQSATYPFKPVDPNGDIRLCQVADVLAVKTFDNLSNPMNAGDFFGENLDLLVLNGNIQNNSEQTFKFDFIYRFCDRLAHGNIPIVFSRGERDMRGAAAELMEYYTPTDRGVSYYSFRLGSLWGLVLDAGEDKDDDCPEYGFTNCCHEFRLQETRWLQSVIDNARNEYAAPGVKYRLVISHSPFFYTQDAPYDIEQPLYTKWCEMLKEHIKPHLMLSGQLCRAVIAPVGGELDSKGQPCPAVISGEYIRNEKNKKIDYLGAAVTLAGDKIRIDITNKDRNAVKTEIIDVMEV